MTVHTNSIKLLFCLLALFLVLISCKECNVVNFGAKGDGITDDTLSIQKAINSCFDENDETSINTVLFPTNLVFLSFPLVINYNNTRLLIESNTTINSNSIPDKWPINSDGEYQSMITVNETVKYVSNIIISGNNRSTSIIDGNGNIFWELDRNNSLKYARPLLMNILSVSNISIYNLTIMNGASWNLNVDKCNNVSIHNINVLSPNEYIAPNTDGIDIGSNNVHIYDCYVSNGDDSYTLKSGSNNVLIENSIAAYPGNGIVIGTGGNIQNVIIRNMIVDQTQHGIHLKAKDDQNGFQTNISFYNITFNRVLMGIDLSTFNQSVDNYKSNVTIQNILFENITGTYEEYAGHLNCQESNPCYNLIFRNIDLMPVFTQAKGWQCSDNVYGSETNVNPPLKCLNRTD